MKTPMKPISIGILISLLTLTSAHAAGWASVHKYVKRSGNCSGQEVLASYYSSGKRTANGERFDASGNTAAARTWPLGTRGLEELHIAWAHALTWRGARLNASGCAFRNTFVLRDLSIVH